MRSRSDGHESASAPRQGERRSARTRQSVVSIEVGQLQQGRWVRHPGGGTGVVWTGAGPQTQVEGRWGDYSDLTVDPTDDCTFWYAQEYLGTDLIFGAWHTRIVSFRFPGCK